MKSSMSIAVLSGLLLAGSGADAQTPPSKPRAADRAFDIAELPVSDALNQFARQTGLQVVIDWTDGSGIKAAPVNGNYTPEAALQKLLAGTGLEYEFLSERVVAVKPAKAGSRGEALRLTQVAPQPRAAAGNDETGRNGDQAAADGRGIPEILVRGSSTVNADIERTEDATQPYVVFDREQIGRSRAENLEEFLRTRLPMNTVRLTRGQFNESAQTISSVDLRGLGQNQTLIVVDGRRMPGVFDGADFGQPDINGIPLAAIERIEVLPSTAGGIYGGGATGGVVNIVMRQDYSGAQVSASYGNTADTDAANRRIDASGGFSLNEGRTRVRLAASHADSNPILVSDRDFALRGRDLMLRNNPSQLLGNSNTFGYTTNIRSSNGSNLVLKNQYGGTALNSPITFVPAGYRGLALDGAAPLVANAGRYNLALPDDLNGNRRTLLNTPTVKSASFNVRQALGERAEAFADASWYENRGRSATGFITGSATLQSSVAANPFTTAIRVRFPETSIQSERRSESETFRAVGGLILRFGEGWTAEADYTWSRSRQLLSPRDPVVGDPDGFSGPRIGVDAALANGTLNTLRDLNVYPLDYTPYLLPRNVGTGGPFDVILKDATLRTSGPVLELPGGALMLAGLLERRREQARDSFQDYVTSLASLGSTFYPQRAQKVDSVYLEARAPLVSEANALSGMRGLELQASVRRDEYATTSSSPGYVELGSRSEAAPELDYVTNKVRATKFTVGFLYSPLESLALRASMGTGFLPASVGQIGEEPPFEGFGAFVSDPGREGVPTFIFPVDIQYGGNPALRPEESASWSAGAIFTPGALPGLRLSIDYTRVTKQDEISSLTEQQVVDLEAVLPGRIRRAELTDEDREMDFTAGAITFLDLSLVNLARTRVEAYDIQLDYDWTARGGAFHAYTLATWQPRFERQLVPGSRFLNRAGYTNATLEWRGNAGLDWERGPWTLGWNAQFYDSYFVYDADAVRATALNAIRSQGSDRVPAQLYHDMFVRYRFGSAPAPWFGALSNAELTLGVQNLFDEYPPILATGSPNGGYSTYGDPRLRRYSLGVRIVF